MQHIYDHIMYAELNTKVIIARYVDMMEKSRS